MQSKENKACNEKCNENKIGTIFIFNRSFINGVWTNNKY